MTIKAATPYLILNGRTPQAIEHYQRALGAKVDVVTRFGDVDGSCPDAMKNLVMHAALRVGDALLMMSDGPGDAPQPPGGRVNVALDIDDPDEADRCFSALADGGTVVQPLHDAPWGGRFGALTDAFGINWMFNSAPRK